MTLLVILACLVAERLLLDHQPLRRGAWFQGYLDGYRLRVRSPRLRDGALGLLLLLAPPLVAVALLQAALNGTWGGLPGFLFAGAVLLLALGPRDLDSEVAAILEARDPHDPQLAARLAEFLDSTPPRDEPETLARSLAERILEQGNARVFAVLFWFAVLGPLGAFGYRLARLLREGPAPRLGPLLPAAVDRLLAILDWIPARITALCYALTGGFDEALDGWRAAATRVGRDGDRNRAVLVGAGLGALHLDGADSGRADTAAEAALGLYWRALLAWLLLIALGSFAGWV